MRPARLFRRRRPPGRHAATARTSQSAAAVPQAPAAVVPLAAVAAGPVPAAAPAARRPALPVGSRPSDRVRLGFTDGTEIELDEGCGASKSLHEAARRIIEP